jgi:fructose-bisphosphate aldolase class I
VRKKREMSAAGSFKDELIATARKIATPGRGILAADESTGTIGKRLSAINLENTENNRRAYRELLFTTAGDWQHYISGVILYEETLHQSTADGKPFVDCLTERGVVPGIKVDAGTGIIPGTDEETYTQGLDGLAARCKKYYEKGARFSKWRAVLKITKDCPTDLAIHENAHGLAAYGAISQANGLVPIIEPEILSDGEHDLERCAAITEKVIAAVVQALHEHHILFEGMLLKPNMVLPGAQCSKKYSAEDIAEATVRVLRRTLPSSVPAVCFLSGGQGEEEATLNLNAMNKLSVVRPWSLTFSYGRALQSTVLKTWGGKAENVTKAQEAFLLRARANGLANLGKYTGDAATDSATSSLYEKDYKY